MGIDDSRLVVGNLELSLSERQVLTDGKRAHLTRREFRDRSVDTHVNHIRRRLRAASPDWEYIHTHFGHGYRLEPKPVHRSRAQGRQT